MGNRSNRLCRFLFCHFFDRFHDLAKALHVANGVIALVRELFEMYERPCAVMRGVDIGISRGIGELIRKERGKMVAKLGFFIEDEMLTHIFKCYERFLIALLRHTIGGDEAVDLRYVKMIAKEIVSEEKFAISMIFSIISTFLSHISGVFGIWEMI